MLLSALAWVSTVISSKITIILRCRPKQTVANRSDTISTVANDLFKILAFILSFPIYYYASFHESDYYDGDQDQFECVMKWTNMDKVRAPRSTWAIQRDRSVCFLSMEPCFEQTCFDLLKTPNETLITECDYYEYKTLPGDEEPKYHQFSNMCQV